MLAITGECRFYLRLLQCAHISVNPGIIGLQIAHYFVMKRPTKEEDQETDPEQDEEMDEQDAGDSKKHH